MRQECVMGVALLVNNAQGMEKGSLDTLNYLCSEIGVKLPIKKNG